MENKHKIKQRAHFGTMGQDHGLGPRSHFGFILRPFWYIFGIFSNSWEVSQPLWNHFPIGAWMLCCTTSKTTWAESMHKNFKGPSKSPDHPKCRNTSRCGSVASAFSIIFCKHYSNIFKMDLGHTKECSRGPAGPGPKLGDCFWWKQNLSVSS